VTEPVPTTLEMTDVKVGKGLRSRQANRCRALHRLAVFCRRSGSQG